MTTIFNKAELAALTLSRQDPIREIVIPTDNTTNKTHTICFEGNITLTKQLLKKTRPHLTKESVGCECGWRCISNNKSEMRLKARLHTKVCRDNKYYTKK